MAGRLVRQVPASTLLLCAWASWCGGRAAGVCINEVLYDPAGADSGREFVELFNADSSGVSLEGWQLEAGNGAQPGDWRVQWRGRATDRIAARGFFLIAGPRREEPADARAPLELQNGPDAVRLCAPDGVRDRVGWGALEEAEFFEGRAAPDAASGSALARVPDGIDRDDNAADFQPRASPTPGRTNAPAGALSIGPAEWDPPLLDPAGSGRLRLAITNGGAGPIALAALEVRLECPAVSSATPDPRGGDLAPGGTARLCWSLAASPDTGTVSVAVSVRTAGGERCDAEFPLRIGRGAVWISEVSYDPASAEGEWVELRSAAARSLDLRGWQLADASGQATTLGPDEVRLPPGGLVVVAQDPEGLRGRWPELDPAILAPRVGSWPSLNNSTDPERGYADQVLLSDAGGLPVDYVRYCPGDLDGDGVTLERWIEGGCLVDPATLFPCPAPRGGTPGASNGAFSSGPQPFFPDRAGWPTFCRIVIPGPADGAREITADVFSLAGTRIATLAAGARAGGPALLSWDGRRADGRPLPTGIYLVRAAVRSTATGEIRTRVCPVSLVRDR
jgi:hypothetical protein